MKNNALDNIKVAVIQTEVSFKNDSSILDRVEKYIEECAENGANLVCLPEYFSAQINYADPSTNSHRAIAEQIPGKVGCFLQNQAKKNGVHITAGVVSREGEQFHNSAILIDPEGKILGSHNKICLSYVEQQLLSPGNVIQTYDTILGKLGIVIGNDLNSFEICQRLLDDEVEIVICLVQMPEDFYYLFTKIMEARVVDLDAFVIIASNTTQSEAGHMLFKGISRVLCNPKLVNRSLSQSGIVLAEAENKEAIIYGECQMDLFRENRKRAARPNKIKLNGDMTKWI